MNPVVNRKTGSGSGLWTGLALLLVAGGAETVYGQGCIASRGAGGAGCALTTGSGGAAAMNWEASIGYRWLHSDRMFSGDVEQTQREAEGSQEINDSHFLDVAIKYSFTPRWSTELTIPLAVNDRSQVVRALNAQRTILGRFHTQSAGLGDLRWMTRGWIFDPTHHPKGNVQVGLGLSMPTGDRDVQDTFLMPGRRGPFPQVHAVDQSIQLGAGGWGAVFELSAFRQLVPRLAAYAGGSYTATPEVKYTPTASLNGPYSIADAYVARGGLEWAAWPAHSVALSLGGRIEGVPVHDLVGGSEGFRRPGYAVSIEPGVSVMLHTWTASLTAPVAVYRNRQQSVPERDAGLAPVAAGFADVVVILRLSKSF
jgi:hypothetical protein